MHLHALAEEKPDGCFIFTSNVDGQFQKAGFDEGHILECHGSIHYFQCSEPCSAAIWSADETTLTVDPTTLTASAPLPQCPHCGATARPNILMFGDGDWISGRTTVQEQQYEHWLSQCSSLVVIECGAGTAVPTVRYQSEQLGCTLIRINPRESQGPPGCISIPTGAQEGLSGIIKALRSLL